MVVVVGVVGVVVVELGIAIVGGFVCFLTVYSGR
jgi:hypothetical protein